MKKFLFALIMLAFVVSALPQARGADVSLDFIYDNLSGGNWIEAEGYGYGWQPDVAVSDPNWRPYADGYWAYTDYGWTWISYEDFGWATYHYGRWASLADYGWVWFPGSDLDWGPAWVSWRTGGDYIGWAPLPPRGLGVVYEGQPIGARVDVEYDIGPQYYNFCDVRFIGEPVLRDRIFPPTQNITYINNTVNVTNITVQNNVVYNYGPDINVVSSYSSRPIQRLTIERQAATDLSAAAKSGALTKVQGNKLLVGAPNRLVKAPPSVAPPAVKAKVAQPKFEHGWAGVQNRAELEQKIKTENPKNIPPPTRAAARPAGSAAPGIGESPAAGGARLPISPGPRGKAGRTLPGATAIPPHAASPFERGKPMPGGRPRPGLTAAPAGPAGLSPSPFERGKPTPGGRPRPGLTAAPPGPAGLSPSPFERGKGRPGGRPPLPGATANPAGALGTTTAPSFRPSPPPPEHGRPPARRLGESPGPAGGNENVSPQDRGKPIERQRFGTPAPMGAGEGQGRGGEQRTPPAVRQPGGPAPAGAPPGEARGGRQPGPGFNQPGGPARTGVPATAEHGQGQGQPQGRGQPQGQEQPQRGQKKGEKGTPPPGPQ